ncbi:CD8A protein, partial [Nothocercus julius]|nr:CD8A protein [Nothocercus julius]
RPENGDRISLSPAGCCGIQGQRGTFAAKFRDSKITHPLRGQRLELECRPADGDVGVSWIKQEPGGTLRFLAFINTLSRVTYQGSEPTSTRFEAAKESSSFRLAVKSFSEQDQGTYFCLINKNQMLLFSTGQAAFFPVTTTKAPTTAAPTARSKVTPTESCTKTPAPETSKEKGPDFTCSMFIWIPLACSCLIFLIALVITVTLCQSKGPRSASAPR